MAVLLLLVILWFDMSNSVPKPATDCFVVINYVECEVISLECSKSANSLLYSLCRSQY